MKKLMMALAAGAAMFALELRAGDAYVESDGTQFVNTGYHVTPRTKVWLDYESLDTGTGPRLMGTEENPNYTSKCLALTVAILNDGGLGAPVVAFSYGDRGSLDAAGNAWNFASPKHPLDAKRHQLTADMAAGTMTLTCEDGTFTAADPGRSCTRAQSAYPLGLFGSSGTGSGTYAEHMAKMRVYGFKIYEEEELVRDYVPAVKAGVVGLYDRVGGGFISDSRKYMNDSNETSQSPGALASGGDGILQIDEDPYVESDGRQQAVNLGHIVTKDTRYAIDFAVTDLTANQCLIGPCQSDKGHMAIVLNTNFGFVLATSGTEWGIEGRHFGLDTKRHTMIVDGTGKITYVTGCTTNATGTFHYGDGEGGHPLTVFATPQVAAASSFGQFCKAKVYGIKVWEKDEPVMDLVPAQKSGSIGFYDKISGRFYKDTRKFIDAGGDWVKQEHAELAGAGALLAVPDDPCIVANGTQAINLGYYPGPKTSYEIDYALCYDSNAEGMNRCLVGPANKDCEGCHGLRIHNDYGLVIWTKGQWRFYGVRMWAERERHTIVVDMKNKTEYCITGCTTNRVIGGIEHDGNKSPYPMALFGSSDSGKTAAAGSELVVRAAAKIYGFKLWEDGVPVMDLIPAMKAGSAGFYDQISGRFFKDTRKAVGNGNSPDYPKQDAKELEYEGTLPEIEEDAYVESTGKQGINLGIYPGPNTRFDIDFAYTDQAANQMLLGANNADDGRLVFRTHSTFGCVVETHAVGDEKVFGLRWPTDFARHTFIADVPNGATYYVTGCTTNGTTGLVNDGNTCKYPISLFGMYVTDTKFSNYAKAKVYGVKVYESGTLVRDLVPYVKGGVVGFRDAANGDKFYAPGTSCALTCGGAIETDGSLAGSEAYVASSGKQLVNTQYHAKPNTRIELDYAMQNHAADSGERLLATYCGETADDLEYEVHCNSAPAGHGYSFGYFGGAGAFQTPWSNVRIDLNRRTAVVDFKNGKLYIVGDTLTNEIGAVTATAKTPLCLFGRPTNTDGTAGNNLADIRVYSLKIYEDDELVHNFLPGTRDGKVGLVDALTGDFVTDGLASGEPLTMSGCGADGETFAVSPQTTKAWRDEPGVLKALAAGAVSYQWYKNGEAIEGATGEELSVPWAKGANGDQYTVRAKFVSGGKEIERESAAGTVEMCPDGLLFIVR